MRKAPQEIFPKVGAGRGWIWNNDVILCPFLGCNEPEDWWGHSCYGMMLEGVLRGSASPRENYRKWKVQGKAGKREFMASRVNGAWGLFLEAAFLSSLVFVCFTPVRVHPERTWPAGENNRRQLAVSVASRCCFLVAFSLFSSFLTAAQVTCSWILQLDSAMVLSVSPCLCAHVLEGLFVKEIWKGEQIGDEVLTFLHKDDLFPSPSSSPKLLPRRAKKEM